jgi:hypothetical protein
MGEQSIYPEVPPPASPPRKKGLAALLVQTGFAGALSGALAGLALGMILMVVFGGAGGSGRSPALGTNELITYGLQAGTALGIAGGLIGLLIGLIAWVIERLFKR